MLQLLHLCDSLFPIGGFAHSDGLEAATSRGEVRGADGLRAWLDACLDETIGRLKGPAVWQAWRFVRDERWDALIRQDDDLTALRPSSSARRASRTMGQRLLVTWRALHPDDRLDRIAAIAQEGAIGPTLPTSFAAACACAGVGRREAVEAFAYTRLASTVSTAMRLMPVGQRAAHECLARALDRVPGVADRIAARDGEPESFAPALDIASMTQQYLHSRLFRS
jgi:urease accessory protein